MAVLRSMNYKEAHHDSVNPLRSHFISTLRDALHTSLSVTGPRGLLAFVSVTNKSECVGERDRCFRRGCMSQFRRVSDLSSLHSRTPVHVRGVGCSPIIQMHMNDRRCSRRIIFYIHVNPSQVCLYIYIYVTPSQVCGSDLSWAKVSMCVCMCHLANDKYTCTNVL